MDRTAPSYVVFSEPDGNLGGHVKFSWGPCATARNILESVEDNQSTRIREFFVFNLHGHHRFSGISLAGGHD